MDRIILEDRFTLHQKLIMLVCVGGPLFLMIITFLKLNLNLSGYLMLLVLVSLFAFLICIAFLKRGFIKIKSGLYRGSFFLNRLIFKKNISLKDRPKAAILKFKKSQKFAFFSAARPDLASGFNAFDIYLLNENHTKRYFVLSLKKESRAIDSMQFLTTNFNIESEVFSPRFQ